NPAFHAVYCSTLTFLPSLLPSLCKLLCSPGTRLFTVLALFSTTCTLPDTNAVTVAGSSASAEMLNVVPSTSTACPALCTRKGVVDLLTSKKASPRSSTTRSCSSKLDG